MVTLIYSILATNIQPFSNATLLVADNGQYLLTIPAQEDWTSAEIQINNYPSIDIEIANQVIEVSGQFFDPEEDIWIDIAIAKGEQFGGSYRFPLDIVPIPSEMPRITGTKSQDSALEEPSFWWRNSDKPPKKFFWEKYYWEQRWKK